MTLPLWQTMIALVAGAGLGVHWQHQAGVTQQALAVLLIVFYVSMQTAMNVAIQQRKGWRKLRMCVCAVWGLAKVGWYPTPACDVSDPGGVGCLHELHVREGEADITPSSDEGFVNVAILGSEESALQPGITEALSFY